MKHILSIFLILNLSIINAQEDRSTSENEVSIPVSIEKGETGKRIALVFGNAHYKVQKSLEARDKGELYYPPINDANDIAQKLEQFNFKIIKGIDSDLQTMDSLTTVFKKELKNKNYSTALFYFAGHGSEEEGINYVYAIEENKEGEIAKYEVGQIMEIMKKAKVETKIVILDACRDDPSSDDKKIVKQNGLTKMDTPVGSFVVYATAPGLTAANKGTNERNGLFTQHLLKEIGLDPDKKMTDLFQQVSINMLTETNKTGFFQVPFLTTSLKKPFYFDQKLEPFKKDSLYGFKDRYGSVIIKPTYTAAWPFLDGKAAVIKNRKLFFIDNKEVNLNLNISEHLPFVVNLLKIKVNDKYGFINTHGEVIIKIEYDYVSSFINGLALVIKDEKKGFINTKGEVIGKIKYDEIRSYSEGFALVKKDSKWGIINAKGEVIGKIEYEHIDDSFSEGLFQVRKDKKKGFINTKGEVVGKIEYDEISFVSEGFIGVKKDGKWGYINIKGEVIVKIEYDEIDYYGFKENLVRVRKDGKWGFFNTKGEVIGKMEYNNSGSFGFFGKGIALVIKDGKKGFINTKGEVIVKIEYDNITHFSESLVRVSKDKKTGLINTKGEVILKIEYDEISFVSEGFAVVIKDEKMGFINAKGEVIVKMGYDEVDVFDSKDDLFQVSIESKWGIINNKGEVILKIEYDEISYFNEGFAAVKKDDKWGFINIKGEVIVKIEYDDVVSFKNGFSQVCIDGKCGYINTKGEVIGKMEYDDSDIKEPFDFEEGFAVVKKDGKLGVLNTKGNILLEINYVDITKEEKGFIVNKNYRFGFIDLQGKIVVPIIFDKIKIKDDYLTAIINDKIIFFTKKYNSYYSLQYTRKELELDY